MKTKGLIILLVLVCASLGLKATADLGYIITRNDTIICKEIKPGAFNMHITLTDGIKQKISRNDVSAFYSNGKRFDKMQVVLNGKPTGETKFMELLCQRNGLKLYKHKFFCCGGWNTINQKMDIAGEKTMLLVYKENDYYLQFDKRNAKNLSEYFHLKGLQME